MVNSRAKLTKTASESFPFLRSHEVNLFKKLIAFNTILLSIALFSNQLVIPLENHQDPTPAIMSEQIPLAAETTEMIQIEPTPTVKPIRLRLVPDNLQDPTETMRIELDIDLNRSGDALAKETEATRKTTVATTKTKSTTAATTKPTTAATTTSTTANYEWQTFTATFYAGDQKGLDPQLRTATGTTATAGRTIAVDPKVIPYGTKVYIEGYGIRIAEDCGGFRGNHIDIFVNKISEIPPAGKIKVRIRIIK